MELNEKRFREVERRAADVIEVVTHTGLKYEEGRAAVDMCQAIQDMKKESETRGRLMQAQESARKLDEMGIDTEKIAQIVGYAADTVNGWLGNE